MSDDLGTLVFDALNIAAYENGYLEDMMELPLDILACDIYNFDAEVCRVMGNEFNDTQDIVRKLSPHIETWRKQQVPWIIPKGSE